MFKMKNTKTKKILAIAAAIGLIAVSFGTTAYFTDRANTELSGKAGTVDIEMSSNVELLDADGKNILNPGDVRAADFAVSNIGNKSVVLRETITLTSSEAMNKEGQAEYEIYKTADITAIDGVGTVPYTFNLEGTEYTTNLDAYKAFKSGATLEDCGMTLAPNVGERTMNEDGTVITYFIDGIVLDGKSVTGDYTDAELDTEAGKANSENAITSTEGLYSLVFKGESGNTFQDSTVTLNVNVDAKQYRNTNAGWVDYETQEFEFAN